MMKKIFIGAVLLGLVGIGIFLAAKPGNKATNTSTKETVAEVPNTVQISNFKFGPASMSVKKGTTITWINRDDARHNVQSDQAGGPLESPLLGKGQEYKYTFNEAGSFSYKCSPHPYMKGSITVTP